MRSIVGCVGCVVMAAAGGLGCGAGALPSDEVTLPDALTCASTSWNVVHSFGQTSTVPSNLAFHDGVFYVAIADVGIVALPATGGDPVVLTTETASKLWIEGDSIYLNNLDDKLRQLPLTGGTPAVVTDGTTTFVGPSYGFAADAALDASYLYWDLSPQVGPATWSVWRAARAGGAAEKMADLPVRDPSYSWVTLTATPDALIVSANTQNVAYAVPLAGGGMRKLAPPPPPAPRTDNAVTGSSAAGVLWTNEFWDAGALYPTTFMSISGASDTGAATARPFWQAKPPFMRPLPLQSWADGAGGWIITGTETLADRSTHTSLWQVDADGAAGRRLACDPNPGFGSVWSTVTTVDAFYAIVSTVPSEWLLVRIDRVPAAPVGA